MQRKPRFRVARRACHSFAAPTAGSVPSSAFTQIDTLVRGMQQHGGGMKHAGPKELCCPLPCTAFQFIKAIPKQEEIPHCAPHQIITGQQAVLLHRGYHLTGSISWGLNRPLEESKRLVEVTLVGVKAEVLPTDHHSLGDHL